MSSIVRMDGFERGQSMVAGRKERKLDIVLPFTKLWERHIHMCVYRYLIPTLEKPMICVYPL